MKAIFKAYQEPLLLLLFYAFLATAFLAPIASEQLIPALVDYTNHIAYVIEAKMAFAEGQFPLRIAPLELSGWRYPNYQFYAPTTYTFAGLIYQWLTPTNPIIAVKFTIWCGLILGGIYMQRLAYWFVKSRPAAILASIVYLTTPYYIVIVTGFGNLCETVALGILPAVLYYSLQRYMHPKDNKTLLQMGLAWYLLITIHLVTFIYTAIFFAILLIVVTCKNPHHWKNLFSTGIGIAFGCLLAMWFLGPIGLLHKYLLMAQTISNTALFKTSSPSISNLLFPGHLQFQGTLGNNQVAIGLPIVFAVGICFYAFANKSRLHNPRANYWLPPLLILFLLAFMLIWSPISFWQWLPSLFLIGQYCWRLLDQLIWIGALLFAWAVCWLFKNKLDLQHIIIGGLLLIITASAAFPTLYMTYFTIDLAHFIKHPHAVYNPNAYTIEFNKHTGFVDKIDSLTLYSLMTNKTLQLNTIYALPQTLLHYTKTPTLSLHGSIPKKLQPHSQLRALLNSATIATFNLVPGKFHWEIPISSAVLSRLKDSKVPQLQFKISNNTNNTVSISIDEIVLSGFLSAPQTLNVKAVQPFCQQQKTMTICKMNVPKATELLELPILYYPKLLRITRNGQTVPYKGIVYQDNLIAGITPEPGKANIITIEFTGLMWANYISWLSWGLWLTLFIVTIFNVLAKSKREGRGCA